MEAFKARHKDKPFTLTHCWVLIKDCPKFKDQYNTLKKNKGGKAVMADEVDLLKRLMGTKNSKADENRDASFIALQGTLEEMMRKRMRGRRGRPKGRMSK